jgi:2-oxoglutarate dehydrogenase E2 component (dihydrolipoamide succinyltransferase)
MTAPLEIRFPADQQEGTEAVMQRWLKAPGEAVAEHEPIAEIETDKVVVEVAAPTDGTMGKILVKEGDPANPGDILCTLLTSVAEPAVTKPTAPESKDTQQITSAASPAASTPAINGNARAKLSPAVRNRLMRYQLDAATITGSGKGGRITVQDVEGFVKTARLESKTGTPAEIDSPDDRPVSPSAKPAPAGTSPHSEKIPHNNMRKRIAENMVASLLHTAPHVTSVFEADLSAVMRHRAAHKAEFEKRGTPLTLTAYFVAASVAAIRKVPQANSRWHDDHLEIFGGINIGIGTALGEQGLIVPVLHQAEQKNLKGIAAGLADLTGRARSGKLSPSDVRGGTFTISNHGVSGSLIATPIIINQPQSSILGVGKIEKRVKVKEVDGEDVITIRPSCYVSLTIDHRVLDGYQTNAFLSEVVATLENWPA